MQVGDKEGKIQTRVESGSAEHLKGQDPWSNGLGLRHHHTRALPSPVQVQAFQGRAKAQHASRPGFIVLHTPALSPLAGGWGAGCSPAGRVPRSVSVLLAGQSTSSASPPWEGGPPGGVPGRREGGSEGECKQGRKGALSQRAWRGDTGRRGGEAGAAKGAGTRQL